MRRPSGIVAAGYDAIAERYLRSRLELLTEDERSFLDRVLAALPPRARVVELGCGPGVPFTAALTQVARVVAVDLSPVQLRLARERAPRASLVHGDMTTMAFRPGSVDAVVAFASFGHVPLPKHPALYRSIASWLVPGGLFASEHPTGDNPEQHEDDWLGAPMYFSHPDLETSLSLLRAAGFALESVDDVRGREEDGSDARWAGVIARLPAGHGR